ncbi:MAG TPA: hypothetical protein VGK19_25815 [Capsulimonadaceae bacterium]|jgi:hypothetical protein
MQNKKQASDASWEIAGTLAGFSGCGCIVAQLWHEWNSHGPSSLSTGYLVGFLVIFAFWTAYGVRFSRPALWLTNGIGAALQALLLAVVHFKQ